MEEPNLFVLSGYWWLIFDQWMTLIGAIMAVIGLLTACWAFFHQDKLKMWFTKNQFPNTGEEAASEDRWDGLIFTVSNVDTPKWVIGSRKPKVIGLLATEQSHQYAAEIKEYAEKMDIDVLDPVYLKQPDDVKESHFETGHLIQRMKKLNYNNIAIDITGGKKPMSLGAFMASEEEQLSTLYVSSEFNDTLRKPDMTTAKLIAISEHL